MALWQIALILLAGTWALQAAGTWHQMRHYREILGGVSKRWSDGYLGAGNARSTFGRGVILVLVTSPDDMVRKLFIMEGRSVFARFKPFADFEGASLEALRKDDVFGGGIRPRLAKGRKVALDQALQQIDRARARAASAERPMPAASAST